MNYENWSIAKPQKSISFLPPSVGRKVVETVDMVQTVSLQLPVDENSNPQVSNGPIWKISKNIFIVWSREPSDRCWKWIWDFDSYYWTYCLYNNWAQPYHSPKIIFYLPFHLVLTNFETKYDIYFGRAIVALLVQGNPLTFVVISIQLNEVVWE